MRTHNLIGHILLALLLMAVTGIKIEAAGVSGTVWNDADGDAQQGLGEPPIQGLTVYVDVNDNGGPDAGEPSFVSDVDGLYMLDGLAPGEHRLRIVLQNGWGLTAPGGAMHAVTLQEGETLAGLDFGCALPDLHIAAFDVSPDPLQWGGAFLIKLTVCNIGPVAAGESQIHLYLSHDPVIEPTDYLLGHSTVRVSGLGPGDSRSIAVPGITLPSAPPAGFSLDDAVWIGAIIDRANDIVESDEQNNQNQGVGIDSDTVAIEHAPILAVRYGLTTIPPAGSHAVGTATVGTAASSVLTIRNSGVAPLELDSPPLLSGEHADQFSVADWAGNAVPPRSASLFTVAFAPLSHGPKTAVLSITSNDEDQTPYTMTLTGQGVGPVIEVNRGLTSIPAAGSQEFALSMVDESTDIVLTIHNSGGADLTFPKPAAIVGDDADQFHVLSQPAAPIPPQGEAGLHLRFRPTGAGLKNATLNIQSNDANLTPYTVELHGRGIGPILNVRHAYTMIHDGGTGSFPDTTVGEAETIAFTITNAGVRDLVIDGSLSIDSSGVQQFHVVETPETSIAPRQSSVMGIRFVPTSAGLKNAVIFIISNDGWEEPFVLNLAGAGCVGAVQAEQTIPLVQGWNWISFNTLPEDNSLENVLSSYGPIEGDEIKTAVNLGGSASYSGGTWYGLEEGVQAGVMYQLKVGNASPSTLLLTGSAVPINMPVRLFQGWNWVGFVGRDVTPVDAALADYSQYGASDNDEFKTQVHKGGTTTFFDGSWNSNLGEGLRPGVGYKLLMQTDAPADLVFQ